MKNHKYLIILIITSVIAMLLCTYALRLYLVQMDNAIMTVSFVDVGQGDCAYISMPNGGNVVLDGGDRGSGTHTLIPFLKKQGVFSTDAAIVSHYHSDHAAGILELMDDMETRVIYMPDVIERGNMHDRLYKTAELNGTQVSYVRGGDSIEVDKNVDFDAYMPNSDIFDNAKKDENNNSLVLKLEYGKTSFLFTGDLETDAEMALANAGVNLDADILKVGHHGSRTSTCKAFFDMVTPRYAVISLGAGNSYGHPHSQTLNTLSNVIVYRTDESGTITFVLDAIGIKEIKRVK